MADVLVDTDIFIDHLRGQKRMTSAGDAIHYSVVTRCELFAGHATDERLRAAAVEALAIANRTASISRTSIPATSTNIDPAARSRKRTTSGSRSSH